MGLTPGSKEWLENIRRMHAEEESNPVCWYYCSFASDKGFLGGVFLQGRGPVQVHMETVRLGLNPGGEMRMVCLGEAPPANTLPAIEFRYRLLDKREMKLACGPLVNSDGEAI